MAGEHLDLTNSPDPGEPAGPNRSPRRFLGVHFECCRRYARVYPNRQLTAFVGHCPGCGRRVEFRIGPEGTEHRFFSVS